jgi:hypothetical protein
MANRRNFRRALGMVTRRAAVMDFLVMRACAYGALRG